jgi:hypothetical protein
LRCLDAALLRLLLACGQQGRQRMVKALPMNPNRAAWGDEFPDALILANESAVKQHADYRAAKTGDARAAVRLVCALVSDEAIDALGRQLRKPHPIVAAVALNGKPYSAKLALSDQQLGELRDKHGGLEDWWRKRFGFGFEALTQSEARYLARTEDADTIRNRVAEAGQGQDGSNR